MGDWEYKKSGKDSIEVVPFYTDSLAGLGKMAFFSGEEDEDELESDGGLFSGKSDDVEEVEEESSLSGIDQWANAMGSKLEKKISDAIETTMEETYSPSQLDKPINEEHTMREFIRDSEKTFKLEEKELDSMTTKELYYYIKELDYKWYCKYNKPKKIKKKKK